MRRDLLMWLFAVAIGAGCRHAPPALEPAANEPVETIPANWISLPDAPFVAEVRGGRAFLRNRTRKAFDSVDLGCVERRGAHVHVVAGLFGQAVSDGSFAPGAKVTGLLLMINDLDFFIKKNYVKPCPPETSVAVISAGLGGKIIWSAENTRWPK